MAVSPEAVVLLPHAVENRALAIVSNPQAVEVSPEAIVVLPHQVAANAPLANVLIPKAVLD